MKEGSFDVKNMVREGQFDTVAAFYLMSLKELWANTDNTFTNDSITSCSLMLINTYGDWHPKEIVVVLRNGIAGNYGKVYGKINTDKVMAWAKEYNEVERTKYFENKYKNESNEIGWNEMNPDLLKKIFKPDDKKADASKPSTYVPRERTPQEQLIQDWMREFDKLSFETHGKRWILIDVMKDGKLIQKLHDIEEYLLYRLEQMNTQPLNNNDNG